MSLINKQIDDLRSYAKNRKGELAKLVTDAADTIELLSAKLAAANLERSSQYYHGGWIPCSERLPEERKWIYWVQVDNGRMYECRWTNMHSVLPDFKTKWHWNNIDIPLHTIVVAWMPLPEPYREVDHEQRT